MKFLLRVVSHEKRELLCYQSLGGINQVSHNILMVCLIMKKHMRLYHQFDSALLMVEVRLAKVLFFFLRPKNLARVLRCFSLSRTINHLREKEGKTKATKGEREEPTRDK